MSRLNPGAFGLLALAGALIAAPPGANAQAPATERLLDIRGFGGWAAGHTNNDNIFPDSPTPIAARDLALDNTYFTLNLLARPTEKVAIHAQPTWQSDLNGQKTTLDLAYVELTLVEDLRLRVGKVRNPLGLYTEVYKVGTLRPFYLLPNSYYRLVPESYVGAGINRVQRVGRWELEADLFAGQMDFPVAQTDMIAAFDPVAMKPVYASVPIAVRGRDVISGGLIVRPPVAGLEVGVSLHTFEIHGSVAGGPIQQIAEERQKAYAASLEYLTDSISLRAEALFPRGYEEDDSVYVEAAYRLTRDWQIAAIWEYAEFEAPPAPVATLDKHRSLGVALNYWHNPNLVFKLNYYRVKYNRAARPAADAVNRAIAGTLPEDTDVVIGGVSFAF